jgi:hypothetical protein
MEIRQMQQKRARESRKKGGEDTTTLQNTAGLVDGNLRLACGRDLKKLSILSEHGWNITLFLDHIASCPECKAAEAQLMRGLNDLLRQSG